MKKLTTLLLLGSCVFIYAHAQTYLNPNASLDARVEDALSRMTTQEKVALVHGWSKFMVAGVPRLGIPELYTSDGPHGVRPESEWKTSKQLGNLNDSCTAFPCEMALAASWNKQLAYNYGLALGEEMRYRDKDVALGPGVNIYRTPLCARNAEYMGEDPLLSGQMAVQYILGMQRNGVSACVKHFALNNQETNRHTVDVRVSERALRELYLSAFEMAVNEANPWSIMGSYNLYNGTHCSHNKKLLIDILRGEWNYQGTVFSDWNGTHDTEEAIHNGLDIEMGTKQPQYYLAEPYLERINKGLVGIDELDQKVRHVLRLNFLTAMNTHKPWGSINTEAHHQTAYEVAAEGIVLLKNDGILPLSPLTSLPSPTKVLVVGENAMRIMTLGGGSSTLKAQYEITPLEGIRQCFPNADFARGYLGDTTSTYDGYQSRISLATTMTAEQLFYEAVEKAKQADIVIFVGGLNKIKGIEREGWDRTTYDLPYQQNELIQALLDVNKNVVFVGISGNSYAMPWVKQVRAIVQAWYLGSEAGHAIADVLSGKVNPSGRLPFTWFTQLNDYPAHALKAYDTTQNVVEEYKDELFVGYRYADLKQSPKPLFAFGEGMSYTQFTYCDPNLTKENDSTWVATVNVTNTGNRSGKVVVPFYVCNKAKDRPIKELKGFEKILLQAGQTKQCAITIRQKDIRHWDTDNNKWIYDNISKYIIGNLASVAKP